MNRDDCLRLCIGVDGKRRLLQTDELERMTAFRNYVIIVLVNGRHPHIVLLADDHGHHFIGAFESEERPVFALGVVRAHFRSYPVVVKIQHISVRDGGSDISFENITKRAIYRWLPNI